MLQKIADIAARTDHHFAFMQDGVGAMGDQINDAVMGAQRSATDSAQHERLLNTISQYEQNQRAK